MPSFRSLQGPIFTRTDSRSSKTWLAPGKRSNTFHAKGQRSLERSEARRSDTGQIMTTMVDIRPQTSAAPGQHKAIRLDKHGQPKIELPLTKGNKPRPLMTYWTTDSAATFTSKTNSRSKLLDRLQTAQKYANSYHKQLKQQASGTRKKNASILPEGAIPGTFVRNVSQRQLDTVRRRALSQQDAKKGGIPRDQHVDRNTLLQGMGLTGSTVATLKAKINSERVVVGRATDLRKLKSLMPPGHADTFASLRTPSEQMLHRRRAVTSHPTMRHRSPTRK